MVGEGMMEEMKAGGDESWRRRRLEEMKAAAKFPPGSVWSQGCPQPCAGGQPDVLPCRKKSWSKFGAGLQMPFGGEKAPGKMEELGTRWMGSWGAAPSGMPGARDGWG